MISAVNVHESDIVLRARYGMGAAERMWRFINEEAGIEIVAFDASQARDALTAFDRYGKGIDAKARLNLSIAPHTRSHDP